MVQLVPSCWKLKAHIEYNFNSTMVQLVLAATDLNVIIKEFQFHYGSISSPQNN